MLIELVSEVKVCHDNNIYLFVNCYVLVEYVIICD